MPPLNDLTGMKFNRLTVVSRCIDEKYIHKSQAYWNCVCDCGSNSVVASQALKRNTTVSCGCYNYERTSIMNKRHGMYNHPLYVLWQNVKARTTNPYATGYEYYGGRGITICSEWVDDFLEFAMYMVTLGWTRDHEIDRINVDGNYEPNNVRIVTRQQNMMNTRSKINATSKYKGVSWDKTRNKWAVRIRNGSKHEFLGRYDDEQFAAKVYDDRAMELHKEYANLNFK